MLTRTDEFASVAQCLLGLKAMKLLHRGEMARRTKRKRARLSAPITPATPLFASPLHTWRSLALREMGQSRRDWKFVTPGRSRACGPRHSAPARAAQKVHGLRRPCVCRED